MTLLYPFLTDETPGLEQVGGKAMSLISMTEHGLPVPSGFVLTVAFFQPWLDLVVASAEWSQVLGNAPQDLEQNCGAVKARCMDLNLDAERHEILARALASLDTAGQPRLFAVRSSSPDEDLEELSFAGGYETVLGVRDKDLEDAIRRSFASAFDGRVLLYKQEHGLAVDQPRIAVIVQQQIPAETAGVAFSLNPINNCYDEAVINANFGLGESVVGGMVSPDSFTVVKGSRTVLEKKIGHKETSVWLKPGGGTYLQPSASRARPCLSDRQVLKLADMIVQVEGYYQKPVDIEWAFVSGNRSDEKLYLLQARPITAYVPLPGDLLTPPEKPKRVYLDLTLVKWGMHNPLSVMGMDYIAMANAGMLRTALGPGLESDVVNAIRPTLGGRVYVNASISLKMQGVKRLVGSFRLMDAGTADIFEHIDKKEYTLEQLPPSLRGTAFRMIRHNLGTLLGGLQALRRPAQYKRKYLQAEERLRRDLARQADGGPDLTTREFARSAMDLMADYTNDFFALLLATEIARSRLKRLFQDEAQEIRDQLNYLERALPNNITIEMGLSMHRLSSYAELGECVSGQEFASRLKAGAFSSELLRAWEEFMESYGFRTPMEMDPATPRFYEQPARFFEQLRTMAESADTDHNPQAIFDRAVAQRKGAYQALLQLARQKGKGKAKRFRRNYDILIEFAGYRETPKYFFVLMTDLFRRRVLAAAESLVQEGRLDHPQQAFDLTMDEFDQAVVDPSLNLRALAEKNTRFLRGLGHLRGFPRVIDSRGKILRPPRKESRKGELIGEPISPGTTIGRANVLHQPDEKPVLPGDILVTRTTDPGWTPLFLNAAGIILEVGGMLQHGALVAREYGKPCVSGLENATKVLQDGQMVELDGTNGIVRLIQEKSK
jgi:phosphohistidine swiveling domain-containing protein